MTLEDEARAEADKWWAPEEDVPSSFGVRAVCRDAFIAGYLAASRQTVSLEYHDKIVGEAQRQIHELEGKLLAASRREPTEPISGRTGCSCLCHTMPGVSHITACCSEDIIGRAPEPSDTDERSTEEQYFETLEKIDPSKEMARVIAQARRDLARRRDTDEREALHTAVARALTNALNYPKQVGAQVLGRDMSKTITAVVKSVEAAGFHRQGQITEAMVEAGSKVIFELIHSGAICDYVLAARAVLEAAEEARRG